MQIAECWIIGTVVQRNWQFQCITGSEFLHPVQCIMCILKRMTLFCWDFRKCSEYVFVVLILWKNKYALTNFSVSFSCLPPPVQRESVWTMCLTSWAIKETEIDLILSRWFKQSSTVDEYWCHHCHSHFVFVLPMGKIEMKKSPPIFFILIFLILCNGVQWQGIIPEPTQPFSPSWCQEVLGVQNFPVFN